MSRFGTSFFHSKEKLVLMSRLGRRVKHVKSEVISHARFVELKYYSA